MDGRCSLEHFPNRKKVNKKTRQTYIKKTSSDGATMVSCACALTENWSADYPPECEWKIDGKWDKMENGHYCTGRGWLMSEEGVETIAQLNAKGIKRYLEDVWQNGPIGGGGKAKEVNGNTDVKLDPKVDYNAKMKECGLIDIMTLDGSEGIKINLKYATADNVAKKNVYGTLKTAYFMKDFAQKIINAHKAMKGKKIEGTDKVCGGIMIYDASRPNSVQKYMYSITKNIFAAPYDGKNKGSLHSYGRAVDLTIYDAKTGQPLNMGAGFDTKGDKSRTRRKKVKYDLKVIDAYNKEQFKEDSEIYKNRKFLYENMDKAGLQVIGNEWWHFQDDANSNDVGRNKGKLLDF
jgi:D-alanyl-D-alanine dipeptidase